MQGIGTRKPGTWEKNPPYCYPNPTQKVLTKPQPDNKFGFQNLKTLKPGRKAYLKICYPNPKPKNVTQSENPSLLKNKTKKCYFNNLHALILPTHKPCLIGHAYALSRLLVHDTLLNLLFFSKFIQFFKKWISRTLLNI